MILNILLLVAAPAVAVDMLVAVAVPAVSLLVQMIT
jgi:hypothetical protein